jgi:hypothetical protein
MRVNDLVEGRVLLAILVACSITIAHAQEKKFGMGIIIGEPTGVSGKMWTSSDNALDAGLAYSFRRKGYVHIHADYLWHFPNAFQNSESLVPYAGLGGRLATGRGEGIFGARFVGGLAWYPRNAPFELFVEFVPILDLAPATEMSGNAGVGVRFIF